MMDVDHRKDPTHLARAHIAPFGVFIGFLVILQLITVWIGWDHPDAPWWRQDPAHFLYPVQSMMCLGLLWYYRRSYQFDWAWKWLLPSVLLGAVGIAFWLLPTALYDVFRLEGETDGWLALLGVQARTKGFDPHVFEQPAAVAVTVFFRFLRAVVVVALVEEIFWRGFLMRFVNDREGDYWKQPFGRPTWISFWVTTILFMIAHSPADFAGAFIYGSLTWLLCVWSKSLGACVLMHAVANLLMCLYILQTGKYGLW
jgi:CAAX prenyl protease-like protein